MAEPGTLSVPELTRLALTGDSENEQAWEAIWQLRKSEGDDVLSRAAALLPSKLPSELSRGADILALLGTPTPVPELSSRCAAAVLEALEAEDNPAVLNSLCVALGHLGDPRAITPLVALAGHANPSVRFGVTLGLLPHHDAATLRALISLSANSDEEIRDWATFALGSNAELVDTPELRDALAQRLDDDNAEIRGEALEGLARLRDDRVREPLRRELTSPSVIILAVQATALLGDPTYLEGGLVSNA